MKLRLFACYPLLLLACGVATTGCSPSKEPYTHTMDAIIYNDNLSQKLFDVSWDGNKNIIIPITLNVTYVIELYIMDEDFSTNPNYKLTYDDVTIDVIDSQIIEFSRYEEKEVLNHIFYSFKGFEKIDKSLITIYTKHYSGYGDAMLEFYLSSI